MKHVLATATVCLILVGLAHTEDAPDMTDWISDSIKVVNRETVNRDMSGKATGMTVVREERINAMRKVTETYGKVGTELEISRRTTEISNFRGKTVMEERIPTGASELAVMKVTTEERGPAGTIRSTKTRQQAGVALKLVERVSTLKDVDGVTTTTVERYDPKTDELKVVSETSVY